MADYDIQAKITANTSGYENGVKKAQTSTDNFTKKLEKLSKKLATIFVTGRVAKSITSLVTSLGDARSEIVKGTGAIGAEFEGLSQSLNNVLKNGVGRPVKELGTMLAELNTRFGVTGESLEKMTDDFDKFAEVTNTDTKTAIDSVADVMNKWEVPLSDSNALLDQLTRATQLSGTSVTELMEGLKSGQSIFSQFGMGVTESTAFLASLSKNGVDSSMALTGMRTALAKFASEGKNPQKELEKISEKIKNAKTDTQALSISMETFGTRAGAEMVRALRTTGSSIDDFTDELNHAGGTMLRTEMVSRSARDAFEDLRSTFIGLFDSLAGDVSGSIRDVIDDFQEFLSDLDTEDLEIIIGNAKAIIQNLFYFISGVIGFIWDNVKALFNVLHGALEKSGYNFQRYIDTIGNYLDNLFKIFQDVFNAIIAILHGNFPLAWEYLKLTVLRVIDTILDNLSALLNSFPNVINKFVEYINILIEKANSVREKLHMEKWETIAPFKGTDLSGITGISDKVEEVEKKIEEMTGKTADKSIKDLKRVKTKNDELNQDKIDGEIKVTDVTDTQVVKRARKTKKELDKTEKEVKKTTNAIAKNIGSAFKSIGSAISSIVSKISGMLKSLINANLSELLDSILIFEDKILTFFVETLPQLPGFLKSVLSSVSVLMNSLFDTIDMDSLSLIFQEMVNTLVTDLPDIIKNIIKLVAMISTSIVDAITDDLPIIIDSLFEIMQLIFDSLVDFFRSDSFDKLMDGILDAIFGIADFIIDNLPEIIEVLLKAVTKIISGVIKRLPDLIITIFKNLPDILWSIVKGVWDLIVETIGSFFSTLGGLFTKLWDKVKSWFTGSSDNESLDEGVSAVSSVSPSYSGSGYEGQSYSSNPSAGMMVSGGGTNNTFNVTFNNIEDTSAYTMMNELKSYNRQMAINGVL